MLKIFKKAAFTLGEVTMVLLIIGFVIATTLMIVKPSEKGIERLYYRAYISLYTATYNIALTGTLPATQSELCQKLIYYINTSKIDSNDAQCNNNSTPLDASTLNDTNLQFIASNAMRFYISSRIEYKYTYESQTNTVPFRVVFIDINGSAGVNRATYIGAQLPDIVGFAVMDNGMVVPMGLPLIDRRYLSARISYPDPSTNGETDLLSDKTSFYDAMNKAWGSNINPLQVFSYKFAQSTDLPATTPLKVTLPAPAAVATSLGCVEGQLSECTVKIQDY